MSNRVVFNIVAERAKEKQSKVVSFEASAINVPTSVILFADARIKELEATIQAMLETAEDAGIPRCQFDDDLK